MFFDSFESGDNGYREKLLEIALLQRRLLELRFDFSERNARPLPVKRKGLFGKEPCFPEEYRKMAEELSLKKQELEAWRQQKNLPGGLYWWKISWEQLVPELLWNLTLPQEEDEPDETGWRRAYQLCCQPQGDRMLLYLQVEGFCQERVHARKNIYDTEFSAYSRQEREQLEAAYQERQNRRALMHMTVANDARIYSAVTGWSYESAYDYYTSSEYLSHRMRDAENYSQSLYTVQETRSLSVSVSGKRYGAINGVAEYHTDATGRLDLAVILDFTRLAASGQAPEGEGFLLEGKDAAVLCAGYLAGASDVHQIPLELFCRELDRCAGSYEEAKIQAQMITCLAGKLERG